MQISCNPSPEQISRLIALSKHKAAKWIKDLDTGDTWYWPADDTFHASVAKFVHVTNYEKGIATDD